LRLFTQTVPRQFWRVLLLLDIGNTHTHVGCVRGPRIVRQTEFPTCDWFDGRMARHLRQYLEGKIVTDVAFGSVVPKATQAARGLFTREWRIDPFELNSQSMPGAAIDYPQPTRIGADRLANAVAARLEHGAPAVVVAFGTAVAFDVVDRRGFYVGGIIAPGLAAMTSYLHEKTALLPRIEIREINHVIGKSTEDAMLIGAVHGYRGLIRELIQKLRAELKAPRLPVIATGGYAKLMARKMPEISAVDPLLTLKGIRYAWQAQCEEQGRAQ
jgi:type III pantothenate kinase